MLVIAALLLFLTGVAHSYLGERYILVRLSKRDNLPKLLGGTEFTMGTLRFVWHLLTVVWWGVAALIYQASVQPLESRVVLQAFSAVALISGLFPLVFTRGRHLSWAVFFVVAALLWFAAGGY
jgi:tryptophan-rich sensory protein